MTGDKLQISAAAALAACFVYYVGDIPALAAVLLAVLVHELGHLAALRLLGLRVLGLRVELKGLCVEYAGRPGAAREALCAAAGPVAGFLFAALLSLPPAWDDNPWLRLTAGLSLLLSFFNLLPALPLDGGRIFRCLAAALFGDRAGAALSDAAGFAVGLLLLAAGLWLALSDRGLALPAAGLWILLSQGES